MAPNTSTVLAYLRDDLSAWNWRQLEGGTHLAVMFGFFRPMDITGHKINKMKINVSGLRNLSGRPCLREKC